MGCRACRACRATFPSCLPRAYLIGRPAVLCCPFVRASCRSPNSTSPTRTTCCEHPREDVTRTLRGNCFRGILTVCCLWQAVFYHARKNCCIFRWGMHSLQSPSGSATGYFVSSWTIVACSEATTMNEFRSYTRKQVHYTRHRWEQVSYDGQCAARSVYMRYCYLHIHQR